MKSKLRHPISSIREPFGTAGLIVAMVALVAALGGTAFAAAKLNSTQKKEVEKIAKKFAGKPGAPGANGTNGSSGAKGDAGAAGANGSNGTNGTNGVSVTTAAATSGTGGECPSGGIKVMSASAPTKVCNGTTGFTKTLPKGETETGTWTVGTYQSNEAFVSISFPIPLAQPLFGGEEGNEELACAENPPAATCQIHYINPEGKEVIAFGEEIEHSSFCPGSVEEPKAALGNLCVYGGFTEEAEIIRNVSIHPPGKGIVVIEYPGASTAGAFIDIQGEHPGTSQPNGWGTWAVTAP